MSIASRIARSPVNALGGWEDQIKTQIALQSAAATAAAEAAGAERKSSHESLLKRYELNSTALAETIKTLKDNPQDPYLQSIYKESMGNLQRSEAELLAFHGYPAKDVAKVETLVFRTLDEIVKEAKEQGVPFAQKGLWSDEWLKFFRKDFPNLDPATVEALWKGRIAMMGYLDIKGEKDENVSDTANYGTTKPSRTMASAAARAYYPDVDPLKTTGFPRSLGLIESTEAGELLNQYEQSAGVGLGAADPEALRLLYEDDPVRDKPVITPTDKRVEMGPFSNVWGGMITLGEDLRDAWETPEWLGGVGEVPPTTGTFLGADNTSQLQAMDQEAANVLTDAAEEFLAKYQMYARQYGNERAMQLLSREWLDLKLRDKRSIQKHYEQNQ